MESDPSLVLPAPDKTLYPVYPAEGDNIGSLTMTTCYPFNTPGNSSDRYIVSAALVISK